MAGSSPKTKRVRRSRSNVAQIGADERLTQLLDARPKLTYTEIRDRLAEEGYELSRSSIGRWSLEHEEARRELKRTVAQARALADTDARAILMLEEANASLLQSQLLAHLQGKREVDKESLEIAYAIAALTSAATQRERVRLAREKAIRIAVARIKREIKRELDKQPELSRQLDRVADGVEARLLEGEGGKG
jgi:hypothetical protein